MKKAALSFICIAQFIFAVDINQVCFYEHGNYQGVEKCYKNGDTISWVGDEFNDRFSSVKVGENVSVEGFEHSNYGGVKFAWGSNSSYIGDEANDRVSSLKIISKTGTYTKTFGSSYISESGLNFGEFDSKKHSITALSVDFGGASVGNYPSKIHWYGNNKFLAYFESGGLTKGVWFEINGGVVKSTMARYKWGGFSSNQSDWIYYMPVATSDFSDGYGLHNLTISYKDVNKSYDEYTRINLKYPDSSGKYNMCVISSGWGEGIWNGKEPIQEIGCKPEEARSQWIVTYAGEIRSAEDDRYCLDSTDSKEGSKTILYECHGGKNQQWYFRGAEFAGDNKYTLGSIQNKDMCYYGGWANKGLTNCQTLELSTNNKFYDIFRQTIEYSLNKAYPNANDLQTAFDGYMMNNPKLSSTFALSKTVTLDLNDQYYLDLIKIVGSFRNTPYGANLVTTVTSKADVKFSDGWNNTYNIAHNLKQLFSYDKNSDKWTIPNETLSSSVKELNLNSLYKTQVNLTKALDNPTTVRDFLKANKRTYLSLYDGYWYGLLDLPYSAQISVGNQFIIKTSAAWNTRIKTPSQNIFLDRNREYIFVFNGNDWVLSKTKNFDLTFIDSNNGTIFDGYNPTVNGIISIEGVMNGSWMGGDYKAQIDYIDNNKFVAYTEILESDDTYFTKALEFEIGNGYIKVTKAKYRKGKYHRQFTDYTEAPIANSLNASGYGLYKINISYF